MDTFVWEFRIGFTDSYDIPQHWHCPVCHSQLAAVADSVKWTKTKKALSDYKESSSADFVFSGLLKCTRCGEGIAISGEATERNFEGEDEQGGPVSEDYVDFTVKMAHPPIHLFEIPLHCSETLKTEIIRSFGLFMYDCVASANRIRVVIEHILTEFGVKRTTINKKRKRVPLFTHSRIDIFAKSHPDVAERMKAIKWIGNEGSHAGDPVDSSSLLQGFELLESILEDLYGNRRERLRRLAKDINKRKGKAKRRRSKDLDF